MYAAAPDIQIGTYADLWQKGRYRVDLTVELPYDPEDVDVALQKLGYDVVDIDQRGRSYRHRQNPSLTAELDELDDQAVYIRLLLRCGGLSDTDVGQSEDQLSLYYERIHQMCQKGCTDIDSDYLYPLPDAEIDPYYNPDTGRPQIKKLTDACE
jgi:hypothetical protein